MVRAAAQIDPRLIAFILPGIPESVRTARLHVQAALGFHGLADYAEDAEIVTSELVTNAVRHASPPIIVEVMCETSHSLQVRVSDATPQPPRRGRPDAHDEGGRGLAITEILSDEWGVDPSAGDGKTVWFRINNSG